MVAALKVGMTTLTARLSPETITHAPSCPVRSTLARETPEQAAYARAPLREEEHPGNSRRGSAWRERRRSEPTDEHQLLRPADVESAHRCDDSVHGHRANAITARG